MVKLPRGLSINEDYPRADVAGPMRSAGRGGKPGREEGRGGAGRQKASIMLILSRMQQAEDRYTWTLPMGKAEQLLCRSCSPATKTAARLIGELWIYCEQKDTWQASTFGV